MNLQTRMISHLAIVGGLACVAAAQKHPAPGDATRNIQVFDVQDIVRAARVDEKNAEVVKDAGVPILRRLPLLGNLFRNKPATPGFTADKMRLDTLASFVSGFVRPRLVEGDEVKSLGNKSLMALASPEKLAWITRFLVENRKQGKYQIEVDARFLKVPAKAFRALVKPRLDASERTLNPGATKPQSATGRTGPLINAKGALPPQINKYALLATAADRDNLLANLEKHQGVTLINAPKILTYPMARADILVGKRISYIKDFEVEVGKNQVIANPIVDTVVNGIHLGCTIAVIPDGKIGMDLEFSLSKVELPMPKFTTSLTKGGAPITIQLPAVAMVRLQTRTELSKDQTALFAVKTPEGEYLVALLRSTIAK